MRTRATLLVIALLLSGTAPLHAQRVEVHPFVGYRFWGGFNVNEPIPGGDRPLNLDIEDGLTWGATVDVAATELVDFEFLWSRQESALSARSFGIPGSTRIFDMAVSQYHGNLLLHFAENDRRVRPFLFLGAGATYFNPDMDGVRSETRFSYAAGGGLKAYATDHAGVRVQFRFTPTYITSTPQMFCGLFCYTVNVGDYTYQGEVSAGLALRF
jgi:hypothetical protein